MQTSLVNVAFFFLLPVLTYFQKGAEAVSGKGEYFLKYLVSVV